jgi:hypothetical protein
VTDNPAAAPGDPKPDPRIQIRRLPGRLATFLAERQALMLAGGPAGQSGPLSRQVVTELNLLADLLTEELRRIRLTLPQACAIADVLNHPILETFVGVGTGLVYGACYEEFQHAREFGPVPGLSSYGVKHGFDEDELLDYLSKLGPAADAALRWAICRFWANDNDGSYAEAFAAAGLRIVFPRESCGNEDCPVCHPEDETSAPEGTTAGRIEWQDCRSGWQWEPGQAAQAAAALDILLDEQAALGERNAALDRIIELLGEQSGRAFLLLHAPDVTLVRQRDLPGGKVTACGPPASPARSGPHRGRSSRW